MIEECCLPRGARLSAKASFSDVSEFSAPAILRSVAVREVAVYCGVSAAAAVVAIAVAGLGEGYLSSSTTSNDRYQ